MLRWPFTASRWHVFTYLCGVALFSISFLVFLNSAVSFVIRDLIGTKKGHGVGNAVGSLGFADELVALIACPFWGLVSDRLGVGWVTMLGYSIVGLSLFMFVQASNVYPQLLLARLLFSLGGAATATMVTAVLPSMTSRKSTPEITITPDEEQSYRAHGPAASISTIGTISTVTPETYHGTPKARRLQAKQRSSKATAQTAGLVGMFTGFGALLALGVFLPLPVRLQNAGQSPAAAVTHSFYIVGGVALAVAVFCGFGLRGLGGEEEKGWRLLCSQMTRKQAQSTAHARETMVEYRQLLREAVPLVFVDMSIGLGCLGGFVARASSVGISTFIPLFVNAYFISSGRCDGNPNTDPSQIKDQCKRAYSLAAALTGVSQVVALVCAPLFGYLDGRFQNYNMPLLTASLAGILGYTALGLTETPDPSDGGGAIFAVMALLGISQIGTIVCSLSILGRGIQGDGQNTETMQSSEEAGPVLATGVHQTEELQEEAPLLLNGRSNDSETTMTKGTRIHLKGTIAGLYSLSGGAGILLLTKLGGLLFDRLSPGAPFYMLAIYNAILLLVVLSCSIGQRISSFRQPL